MDTMIKSDNPLASLLRQALDLTENTTGIPVDIDYEAISRAAIKAAREERDRIFSDPKVLVTQNEAHNIYGKSVITALLRRGKLQPYKFDMTEAYDKSGDLVKRAKGVVYYRVAEIDNAIEEANVLKGIRRIGRR